MGNLSFTFALLMASLTLSLPAQAESARVEGAWARSTVTGQQSGGAFMVISSERNAMLIGAETPAARQVEIHEMKSEGGVMKMRPVSKLELPAGKSVELKPGGYHLMLIGLKKPLQAGDKLPITLKLKREDQTISRIEVSAEVRAASVATDHAGHTMHH